MRSLLIVTLIILTFWAKAQNVERPQLVVGLVVDQLRYDYLYRYNHHYGNDGFKKLLREGFSFRNAKFNYAPTYTAPGHAAVYTGCTPSVNGIVANDWYSRKTGENIYCVSDTTVSTVGSTTRAGMMSPRNLYTTTVTDELKLQTNNRSKVIGISLKDRGAILPAGHTGNAAYWFDTGSGNWITSSYYMTQLPKWVQDYNNKKRPDHFLKEKWELLLSPEKYTESTADDVPYETPLKGKATATFPYDLQEMNADYKTLNYTPFGNEITKEMMFEALKNENLGKRKGITDFLAVSFSTPDHIGHQFGINAIEVEDMIIRFDKNVAEIINYLDGHVGKGNYLFFITSDHGAAHNPLFLRDNKLPGGIFYSNTVRDTLKNYLINKYNIDGLILELINQQIYLNYELIKSNGMDKMAFEDDIANYFLSMDEVADVMTSEMLIKYEYSNFPRNIIQNGYQRTRCGDMVILLKPGWIDWYRPGGTTHGSVYNYDTHAPLIFYGWNVNPGSSEEEVFITDIVPTLSSLLNISLPNGTTGRPLNFLFQK
jgi:predicted AlkP superfamily pyrophosphatase or phosphodiesterase